MNYRDETETLSAENDRLRAKVAEMEEKATIKTEKVPMRWHVGWLSDDRGFAASVCAALYALAVVVVGLAIVGHWVDTGSLPPVTPKGIRFSVVMAVLALAWCLAFVRRVPR